MKILVAEDNTVTATLMSGVLTRHGYTVVLARNASEAVTLLGSEPDIQGVITDIMMPGSSGLDLLQSLQNHVTWRNLPTIVTSVRDDPATVSHAAALGCRDYILKPVRPARLIERVSKVFPLEKVILGSASDIMSRYSLNLDAYRKILGNFASQVDKSIALLQYALTSSTAIHREDLIPLMESSTLLAAERLLAALEEASLALAVTPLVPAQCAKLVEELRLVQNVLNRRNSG